MNLDRSVAILVPRFVHRAAHQRCDQSKNFPPHFAPASAPGLAAQVLCRRQSCWLLLLGTGTRQATALEVGATLLGRVRSGSGLAQATREELVTLPGVGETKTARVLAALEPVRRFLEPPPQRRIIRSGADAAAVCASMHTRDREHFRAILLNTRHEVLGVADVSIGGLASAPVHPREAFKEAIRHRARRGDRRSLPPVGGTAEPSRDDILITQRLRAAGGGWGSRSWIPPSIGERAFVSLRKQRQGFP